METRPRTRARRSYVEFEPWSELIEEKGSETLLIKLIGFSKEQAKVQLEPTGNLKVSGERPLGDNKWSRFEKHFQVSSNCNTDEIRATFEDGVVFIIMPKFTRNTTNESSGLNEPNHDRPISQEAATINDNGKHSEETELDRRSAWQHSSLNQEEKSMHAELESPKLPPRQRKATLETHPLDRFGYAKQSKLQGEEKIRHGSMLKTMIRIQDCKHTSLGSMVVVAILVAVGISINYARS